MIVRLNRGDTLSPCAGALAVSFHDAVDRLRAFLREKGRPDAIVWVNPQDLVTSRSRLCVFVRSPNRRWMDAQVRYELGLDRKMGILLCQICQAPGLSCCHVYIPKNAADATERQLDGTLKFTVTPQVKRAIPITNRLHWAWLKRTGRHPAGLI